VELDLAAAIGAESATSHEVLVLFVPDRDRDAKELGNQRRWVLDAAELLANIGGGVTIEPQSEGGWLDEDRGRIVWEHPVRVWCYVRPDAFERWLPELRSFLHRLGREARQGEVAIEFAGQFFRITEFDA
jgi:hypothetical protein